MTLRYPSGSAFVVGSSTPATGIIGVPGGSENTETAPVNQCLSFASNVVGFPDTLAGAASALADASDATYIGVNDPAADPVGATVGFADLVNPGGLAIRYFEIIARVGSGAANKFITVTPAGITRDPTGNITFQITAGTSRDYYVGRYYKDNVGGTWTAAQINAMTCLLNFTAVGLRFLHRVQLLVHYA